MARFELCFNTSTIRPASIIEKIRAAGEAGYDSIELWNEDLTEWEQGGGRLSELRQVLDDYNLAVPDLVHFSGWMDATDRVFETELLGEARRLMEQGVAVGAPRIIAGPARGQVDLNRAADRFYRLMELGGEVGCLPALEFLGFVAHVNNVDTLMEIVALADHPETTVVMDAFHIYRGGGRDEDILKVPGARVAIFHIDDAPRTDRRRETLTDGDRVYPGDGILNLENMLRMLASRGFSGPVSLELFNETLWRQDAREVARVGAEKVRRLIASVE